MLSQQETSSKRKQISPPHPSKPEGAEGESLNPDVASGGVISADDARELFPYHEHPYVQLKNKLADLAKVAHDREEFKNKSIREIWELFKNSSFMKPVCIQHANYLNHYVKKQKDIGFIRYLCAAAHCSDINFHRPPFDPKVPFRKWAEQVKPLSWPVYLYVERILENLPSNAKERYFDGRYEELDDSFNEFLLDFGEDECKTLIVECLAELKAELKPELKPPDGS